MLWYVLHVKLLWIHAQDCQLCQVQKALLKLENQRETVVLTTVKKVVLFYMHVATDTFMS